jgi:tetratricopeptide (TPR) repeat protein
VPAIILKSSELMRISGENGEMDRTTLTERLRRAEAEIAAGRAEEALNYCQELQSAYPRAIRVQRVLGEIYLALRRPREALATLDRALAGDPEDVRATCARALVHQMHGDNVAALAWYRRACDLRPDDQALRATYRNLALRLGEPAYRPSRAGLARLYLRGDLFSHAIREWEQLVNESPDMLDAQVGLAETLWLGGHPQAADERCRRILANAPACVKAMLIQMAIALAEGDMDAARAHLDRTLQLDPDMAIAQALFADALAAGDPVLTALLRPGIGAAAAESADETLKLSRSTAGSGPSVPSVPLAGQRNVSRPLVTSVPVTGGPANGMPPPLGQPLPPPPRPDVPVPSQPTEVTRAIKETAFMIWGREDDSQPRLAAQRPSVPTRGQTAGPRALEELGGAADDEEARRALNWYNWLQEQGAVALGAATTAQPPEQPIPPVSPLQPGQPVAPEPSATTLPDPAFGVAGQSAPASGPKFTMPLPPSTSIAPSGPGTPGTPEASSMRQTMPLFPGPDTGSGTGPLASPHAPGMPPQDQDDEPATIPLPTADVLRSMFADLGGATSPQPVVDALTASAPAAPNARLDASGEDNIVESAPPATDEPYESHEPFEAYTPSDAYQPDQPSEAQDEPAAGDEPFAPPPSTQEQTQTPQTLEDLERQFSASGFSRIEPRRGMLAEIEREQALAQQTGEGSVMPDYADEGPESGQLAETPTAPEPGPEASSPAPSVSVPSGPDARDYPARLAHARQRRDEGQFDDALNEYKAIIKNAPDLLPEVLSDLRASLDEMPDHPNLHSVLGDALVSQGQYEQAIEAFNKASELAQAHNAQN